MPVRLAQQDDENGYRRYALLMFAPPFIFQLHTAISSEEENPLSPTRRIEDCIPEKYISGVMTFPTFSGHAEKLDPAFLL
jgi:hypothetical protein